MKSKTSVTTSKSLLDELDRVLDHNRNRSEFIEMAVREHLRRIIRQERDRRELEELIETPMPLFITLKAAMRSALDIS